MSQYFLLVYQLPINFYYGDFIEQQSRHDGYFNNVVSNEDEKK